MYEWWIKKSFSKSLTTSIPTYLSWVIGYSLFSSLEGSEWLHTFTLNYVNFFLDKLNYFNVWYALALSVIILGFFLVSYLLYTLFDFGHDDTKNFSVRNINELSFNTLIWVGFSGFWIAMFSPYLEFARETYNYYNIMLGLKIMIISIFILVAVIISQYLFNSYKSPIPLLISKLKRDKQDSYNPWDDYTPTVFNTEEVFDESIPDDIYNPPLQENYAH